jgi:signal transduction histidine kinase
MKILTSTILQALRGWYGPPGLGLFKRVAWLSTGSARAIAALPGVVWMIALLLFGLFLFLSTNIKPGQDQTFLISSAAVSHEGTPGSPEKVRVQLPHHLENLSSKEWERHTYDLTWPPALTYAEPQDQYLGLLIPRVGVRFRVLLNGSEVAESGWRDPIKRSSNSATTPQLIHLPAVHLRPVASQNEVSVEVYGQPMEGSGLSTVQVGDFQELKSRYEALRAWQVTVPTILFAITGLVAMVACMLYRHLKQTLLLYMGASAAAYAIHLLLSGIWAPEFGYPMHFLVSRISFSLYWVLLLLFCVELMGQNTTLTKTIAASAAVVGPVWLLMTWAMGSINAYRLWVLVLVALGVMIMLEAVMRAWRKPQIKPNEWVVFTVLAFTLMTVVRDFLVIYTPFEGDVEMQWLPLHALGTIAAYGWVLVMRSTDSAEEIRAHALEQQVLREQATAELQKEHAERAIRLRREAVEKERARAMRDLHDGLGSQMQQIVMYVKKHRQGIDPDQLIYMVQTAVQDLRVSLTGEDATAQGDIAVMTAALQNKVKTMLKNANIELEWRVREVSSLPNLAGLGLSNLNFFVTEAINNITKHAHAKTVTIRTYEENGHVILSVEDDGIGMLNADPATRGTSQGVSNMRKRAKMMGAELEVISGATGGTILRLVFDGGVEVVRRDEYGITLPPPDYPTTAGNTVPPEHVALVNDEQLNDLMSRRFAPQKEAKVTPDIPLP